VSRFAAAWVALAWAGLTACSPREQGPLMRPGEDCLECHGGGGGEGEGDDARTWSFGGTVFDQDTNEGVHGVKVQLVDSRGRTITAWSNAAGNFYSAESMTPPFTVTLTRGGRSVTGVPDPVTTAHMDYGGCNGCHVGSARIHAP